MAPRRMRFTSAALTGARCSTMSHRNASSRSTMAAPRASTMSRVVNHRRGIGLNFHAISPSHQHCPASGVRGSDGRSAWHTRVLLLQSCEASLLHRQVEAWGYGKHRLSSWSFEIKLLYKPTRSIALLALRVEQIGFKHHFGL